MSTLTHVHWLFKEEATREAHHLCDFPGTAREAEHSIVLRPIFRKKHGAHVRECVKCTAIGKSLGIP